MERVYSPKVRELFEEEYFSISNYTKETAEQLFATISRWIEIDDSK